MVQEIAVSSLFLQELWLFPRNGNSFCWTCF